MAKIKSKEVVGKYNTILAELKNKIYHPVYLLMGEDPYYIDELCNYMLKNILEESEKAFNQIVLYGKDVSARDIYFAAAKPPMMSSYQVVVVKEAQNIKKFDDLETYLKAPLATTILILCHKEKPLNKTTRTYKAILKCGTVLETVKLYDNEIPMWINDYLKAKQVTIDFNASAMLSEAIGSDLTRIANELEKLFILLPTGVTKITAEQIEQNIGISKDFNIFELNNAIGSKNVFKAYQIIQYFGRNSSEHPAFLTVMMLFGFFSKLMRYQVAKLIHHDPYQIAAAAGINPFLAKDYDGYATKYPVRRIAQIISLLREYDLRSKGWQNNGTSDSELMRELIFKLMM